MKDSKTKDDSELDSAMSELLSVSLKPIAPSIEQTSRLTSRLQQRLAKSIADHTGLMTVRVKDGLWRELRQGVRYKLLWQGTAGNSVLIEFAPGAALPVHRHNWLEEGIVLKGGLQMDTLDLKPFDYHVSPPGSRHAAIRSKQGALAFLRGTSLGQTQAVMRELLGGIFTFSR
ncbi:cupin domain-containing protein [Methylocucumis oryzae]|uniref:cupin domain-containing protein n=1 Tax=Methylocucumis oryzae TaxID=1632867 RepID=UPI0012FF1205|nr:cupin domain-containing protein [Methylocucumis oryzae]